MVSNEWLILIQHPMKFSKRAKVIRDENKRNLAMLSDIFSLLTRTTTCCVHLMTTMTSWTRRQLRHPIWTSLLPKTFQILILKWKKLWWRSLTSKHGDNGPWEQLEIHTKQINDYMLHNIVFIRHTTCNYGNICLKGKNFTGQVIWLRSILTMGTILNILIM